MAQKGDNFALNPLEVGLEFGSLIQVSTIIELVFLIHILQILLFFLFDKSTYTTCYEQRK